MNIGEKKRQERIFLLIYSFVFILTAVLVFRWFPIAGRRMVWKGDGLSQHYVALCYYARWGRAVLRSILAGHPAFPTWNMHMGFGADLFTTLQYYVIGDPFSLPAVFVPQRYMLVFHDVMILVRMYLAGLCFDRYCRTMGRRDLAANLCGSLLYVFGSFALFGMRHPYFINAMIWFPLLLTGAEHIFRGRRGRLFTAAVFFSCISNFYFFYMLVILTVVYAVWRALRIYLFPALRTQKKEMQPQEQGEESESGRKPEKGMPGMAEAWKQIFLTAGRFLWRAVLGTALGACFLLPILLRFLQDPRASEGVTYGLLYPADYYKGFAEAFAAFGTSTCLENWTCMGFGGLGLLAVLLMFFGGIESAGNPVSPEQETGAGGRSSLNHARKPAAGAVQHPDLKIAFVCMLAMVLFPAAGAAMNGFTYPANRWIWAFAMLTAYIAAVMLPSLGRISASRLGLILLLTGAYAGVCAALGSRQSTTAELLLAAAAASAVWMITRFCSPGDGIGDKTKEDPEGGIGHKMKENPEGGRGKSRLLTGAGSLAAALVLVGTAVLTAALHGYVCFQRGVRNSDVEEYHTKEYIAAMLASDAAGMRTLLGNEVFYRYSGRYISNNINLLNDVSDTQYYWSLSDSRIEQFFTETGQYNGMVHLYDNLDNRTMLDEIAGVKYYKRGDGSLLPYGYEKLEGLHFDNRELFTEEDARAEDLPVFSFSVYENTYALPLGFTCGQYISRETYDALSIPQRQEALMQGVLLEDEGLSLLQEGSRPGDTEEGPGLPTDNAQNGAERTPDLETEKAPGVRKDGEGIRQADPVFLEEEAAFTMYMEREVPGAEAPEVRILEAPGASESLDALEAETAESNAAAMAAKKKDMSGEPGAAALEILDRDEDGIRLVVRDKEAVLRLDPEDPQALSAGEISLLLTGMDYVPLSEEEKRNYEDAAAGTAGRADSAEGLTEEGGEKHYSNTDPVSVRVTARRGEHVVSDKSLEYTLPDNPWKTGRTDFMVCCGYTEEPLQALRLKFSRPGIYTFREMKVIRQPMEAYPAQAQALGAYSLVNLDLHELPGSGATDRITGEVDLPEERILCIQIPCCDGLRAFVDGQEAALLQADTMFSALLLEAGKHTIELRYRTPGLMGGACISLLACLVLAAEALWEAFRSRRRD